MTWCVKIELPGLPPTPNSVMAMHWAKKSKLTKRWRRDSYLACKANGPAPLGTKVIRVCYTRFSSREPDPDGLAGSFKAIQDGVVDWVSETNEGFDDRAHQLRPAWFWEKAPRGKGRVTVVIVANYEVKRG